MEVLLQARALERGGGVGARPLIITISKWLFH